MVEKLTRSRHLITTTEQRWLRKIHKDVKCESRRKMNFGGKFAPSESDLDHLFGPVPQFGPYWISRPQIRRTIQRDLELFRRLSYHKLTRDALRGINEFLSPEVRNPFLQTTFVKDDVGRLWIWRTDNQRAAFGALVSGAGQSNQGNQLKFEMTRRPSKDVHQAVSLPFDVGSSNEMKIMLRAKARLTRRSVVLLELAKQALQQLKPRMVIVANQHASPMRALIAAARIMGIPSVYLPHAPLATNPQYADMPTDYGSLFGLAELKILSEYGAFTDRISVCGSPMIRPQGTARFSSAVRVVCAPSPNETAEKLLNAVHSAIGSDFVVCPHPRSSLRRLRRSMPSGATLITEHRTSEYLGANRSVLIHSNSGIGLEAIALGSSALNVTEDGSKINYHYLFGEKNIRFADLGALRLAIEDSFQRTQSTSNSFSLRENWLLTYGPESDDKILKMLVEVDGQHEPMLDGWVR